MHRRGVELHRSGRRENELTTIGVEFTIGKTEDVAREDVAAPPITDANMVPGVPRSIQTKKLPASKIDPRAMRRENDSLFLDRQNLPIKSNNFRRPIHSSHTCQQP